MRSETRCPGCGALLAPDARLCQWCGRPLLLRDQRRAGRVLWTIGAAACALAVIVVVLLALLHLPRDVAPVAATASPTPLLGATVDRAPTPTATVAPEPTPEPVEYVRVANTGGQGVILRREPSVTAARVVARAENALLRITGPDATVDGRVWRQVEDSQGNRGWTPAEFLVAAPPPG